MTKEELEKEAENWLRKYLLCCNCEKKCNCIDSNSYCEEQVLKAYLAGAEPREKRIADLEDKLKKETAQRIYNFNKSIEWKERHRKLEAQIEKMKWHNLRIDPNDLPKDRHNVWIVYLNGYYQEERSVASYRHKFWVIDGLKTECEVIAWCELPKWEIKEK